jgi:hypothetical protein
VTTSPLSTAQEVGAGQDVPRKITAASLLDMVEIALHHQRAEWLFLRELRIGTGRRQHEMQRLDAFALNCLPHRGMKVFAMK